MTVAQAALKAANEQFSTEPLPKAKGLSLQPRTYDELERFCKTVAASNLLPKGIDNAADAFVAVQYGASIGLDPMQAIQSVAVINGRPTLWGDTLLGVCRANALFDNAAFHERFEGDFPKDDFAAVCTVRRRTEGAKPHEVRFTVADAKKAGLFNKQGPWQQYPLRMMQMRSRSFALRDAFPDVLKGFYAREEILDSIMEQIDTTPREEPKTLGEHLNAKAQVEAPPEQPKPKNKSKAEADDLIRQKQIEKDHEWIKATWEKLSDDKRTSALSNLSMESIEEALAIDDVNELRSIKDALLGA